MFAEINRLLWITTVIVIMAPASSQRIIDLPKENIIIYNIVDGSAKRLASIEIESSLPDKTGSRRKTAIQKHLGKVIG